MAPPVTVNDTVLYTPRNLFLDKTVVVTLLDGSQLEIWGPVFVDGNPLVLIGALPIATNAEALAGIDNTKVMTPLRVREASDSRYVVVGMPIGVPDEVYGSSWDGSLGVPTKNALYDKIQALSVGVPDGDKGDITVSGLGTIWLIDALTIQGSQIAFNTITNGKLATINANTIKGRVTAATGGVEDLTPAQARTVISSDSGGGTVNYLRADGTWATPAGGGAVSSVNTKTGAVVLNQDEILNGSTYVQYSSAEKSKLLSVAVGATQNSTDATLLNRINHTGSQAQSTVQNLVTDLAAKAVDTAVVHNTGTETIAGSKTFSGYPMVPDEVYNSSWNNSMEVPTKNAVYDKVQSLTKSDVGLGNVDNTSDANAPVSTAQQAALDLKAPLRYTVVTQSGTSYTLATGDDIEFINFTSASAIALTIPTNAIVPFAVGSKFDFAQTGAGKITVAGAGGVTVNGTPSLVLRAQYSAATLVKLATDTWLLIGDLT